MNRYEGLNLPQLLDLLHGIVRPEPVPLTPQTIGWAVIGVWLLVVVALVAWNRFAAWRHNRYRREALELLDAIAIQTGQGPALAAQQVATILKRTAFVAYSRAEVANLYGSEWAAFLTRTAGNDPTVQAAANDLASAAYRTDADGRELIAPARRWVTVHRA